jgi:hypothetical protein
MPRKKGLDIVFLLGLAWAYGQPMQWVAAVGGNTHAPPVLTAANGSLIMQAVVGSDVKPGKPCFNARCSAGFRDGRGEELMPRG